MTDRILVSGGGGDRYVVEIAGRTRHTVMARPEVLARVSAPDERPEETITRAFRFLLAREPAESILRHFAIEDIARYFPDFWTEMA